MMQQQPSGPDSTAAWQAAVPTTGAGNSGQAEPTKTRLVVYTPAGCGDQSGIVALTGEYVEAGTNHGRKFFRRWKRPSGAEPMEVCIYYWDARDGDQYSGWWFGQTVGASNVWSRCELDEQLPPAAGWRVPWDSLQVNPNLVVEVKTKGDNDDPKDENVAVAKESEEETGKKEDAKASQAEADDRVQRASDRVILAEVEASRALEDTQAMLEGDVTDDNIKVVNELLAAQSAALADASKVLQANVIDARKTCPAAVQKLETLAPRLRCVQASIASEMKGTMEVAKKKELERLAAERRRRDDEKLAVAEQDDAKRLEAALPSALEAVSMADELVDAVFSAGAGLLTDEVVEVDESVSAAIQETEAAVTKAVASLSQSRGQINGKIAEAKGYAPDARNVALTEFGSLQDRLDESHKRIEPYMRIRRECEDRLENRRLVAEAAKRIGAAELEVERAVGTKTAQEQSDAELKRAEVTVPPVMIALSDAIDFVQGNLKGAQGSLKVELTEVLQRGADCKKRLQEFNLLLRSKTEGLQMEVIVREGADRTKEAEESLVRLSEAEAPFAKGDAVAPEEASEAIAISKAAAAATESLLGDVRPFLIKKITIVKCFPEAINSKALAELGEMLARVAAVADRLVAFRKETASRESANLVYEAAKMVAVAEARVLQTAECVEPLASAMEAAGADIEGIQVIAQLALEAEREAALACAEARKLLTGRTQQGAAQMATELTKMQMRLTAAQQDLMRTRKVAMQGERMCRAVQVLQEAGEQVDTVERSVKEAEDLTTPLGDERPSDELIEEMVAAVAAVGPKVGELASAVQAAQGAPLGRWQADFDILQRRVETAAAKVEEMKETTTEQRERVACDAILRQGRIRLAALDDAFTLTAEAEVPYLRGLEVLPLAEAKKGVQDSEAACVSVQRALSEVHAFIRDHTASVGAFVDVVAKAGLETIDQFGATAEHAVERLTAFKHETQGRRSIMMQQQTESLVKDAEDAASKLANTATAFQLKVGEGREEDVSAQAAQDLFEKFNTVTKAAEDALDTARRFLQERQREAGAPAQDGKELFGEGTPHSRLANRLDVVQTELASSKKLRGEHEQKFVARMLVREAKDHTAKVEEAISIAADAAAPLLAEGGRRFVVASTVSSLVEGIEQHLEQANATAEAMWAKLNKKAGDKVDAASFGAFLEGLPQLSAHQALRTTPEQRSAIFAHVDSDGDGLVTRDDFTALFQQRYVCVHGISVTEKFEITAGSALHKLEVDDVVVTTGEPRTNETQGMTRVQVIVEKTGATGWATMQGNQGKVYLDLCTTWTAFSRALDRALESARSAAQGAARYLEEKERELATTMKGPLVQCKEELALVRPEVSALSAKLSDLRRRIVEAKKDHDKREEFERRKVEDKRDRKATDSILGVIGQKVAAAEQGLSVVEDAAKPFSSGEVATIADPVSARAATEKAVADADGIATDAKACLAAHEGKAARATKGPWMEAKQELKKLNMRVLAVSRKLGDARVSAQQAVAALSELRLGQVASAVRRDLLAKDTTVESLFAKLAGKQDMVSEKAFEKYLTTLKDLEVPTKHRQMLFEGSTASGFCRHAFLEMVVRYYKCVKEIAITTDFNIRSSNAMRKLELGETVEVLEGPQSDKALGVMRVRCRALSDGSLGWVTATGNQGTPFLQETPRPCFRVAAETQLEDSFASEGAKAVRALSVHEAVEVVEGPRREEVGNALRVRARATRDGAEGWLTTKTRLGVEHTLTGKVAYTCAASVALTDGKDIQASRVVRKLSSGEDLEILEGPIEQNGATRIRAVAASDGAEGWVTTKGSAGSVYVEETTKTLIVCRGVSLDTEFSSESASPIRMLEDDEILDVLEGPTEEVSMPPKRVRVRAVSDGQVGWATMQCGNLEPWSARYKCVATTRMSDRLASKGSKELRRLEAGEQVELLHGPLLEAGLGVLRFKARAGSDGAIGWVTIASAEGKVHMSCKAPE